MIPEWLSVTEAARRLGISAEEVRQRIDAGELKARVDNGHQVVLIDAERRSGEAESTIIIQALMAELRGQITAKDEQLRSRDQELQRLMEQMRAKDQQIERLMVLMAQVQAQARELTQRLLPMTPVDSHSPAPKSGDRRRWWPFRPRR